VQLAVRLGIHTGQVGGEIGVGRSTNSWPARPEPRRPPAKPMAAPNTLVISGHDVTAARRFLLPASRRLASPERLRNTSRGVSGPTMRVWPHSPRSGRPHRSDPAGGPGA